METTTNQSNQVVKSQNLEKSRELDQSVNRIISLRFGAFSKVTENLNESDCKSKNEENKEDDEVISNKNKRRRSKRLKRSLDSKPPNKNVAKIWKRSLKSFPNIQDGKHIMFYVEMQRQRKVSKKIIISETYFKNLHEILSDKKLLDLLNSFLIYTISKLEQAENVNVYKIYMNQLFLLRTYLKYRNIYLNNMISDQDLARARYKPLTDMLNKGNSAYFGSFKKRYLRNKLFIISDDENEEGVGESFDHHLKDIGEDKEYLNKRDYESQQKEFDPTSSLKFEKKSFEQPNLKKETGNKIKKSEYIPVYSVNQNKPSFRESLVSDKVSVGILSLHQNFDDDEFDDIIYDKKKKKKKEKPLPVPEIQEESLENSENKDLQLSKDESKINTDLEDSFNLGKKNINDCPKFNGTYCSEDTNDPDFKKFQDNSKDPSDIENSKELNLKDFDSPRNLKNMKSSNKSNDLENEETTDKINPWKPFVKNYPPNINSKEFSKKLIFTKKKIVNQQGSGLTSRTETKNEKLMSENDFDSFEKDFEFKPNINFSNLIKKENEKKADEIKKYIFEKENEDLNKNNQKNNIKNVERIEEESENESMSEEEKMKKLQNIKDSKILTNNLLETLPDGFKQIFELENGKIKIDEEFGEKKCIFDEFINAMIDDLKEIENETIKNIEQ